MRLRGHRLHRTKLFSYQASWLILVFIVLSLTGWLGWQNGLGRVVLPMRMDGGYSGDSLIQILPLPIFYEAASAIGNIHLISDFDGIVRSVFLRDQIGTEIWERFAVKMLQVGGDTNLLNDLPGLRFLHTHIDTKANTWLSDHRMQIPFAGPPGKIPRVSYIDVLHNQVPQNTFRNKYVLVGITAVGMG